MKDIDIAGRRVGRGSPPFVIAEISGNHNGEIERAFRLIEAAKEAGADAVKLQTYTADTLTIDHEGPGFVIADGLWKGRKLYDLYQEAHTPWEWHPRLCDHARKIGIICFSTPFDPTAVDLLERLNTPAYKIASFEIVDTPLIRYIARTGKPLIISTGMADHAEIADAVAAARLENNDNIVLLHCVSGYPTPAGEANLARIATLAEEFDCVVGLSDHTLGTAVAVAAVALGAVVIEKHVTLARSDGGPDAAFSLEPQELAVLVEGARTAFAALGSGKEVLAPSEQGSMAFRRSLYAVKDIPAGGTFTAENVRSIRPGYGLAPRHLPAILGQRAAQDIVRGTPMKFELILGDTKLREQQ